MMIPSLRRLSPVIFLFLLLPGALGISCEDKFSLPSSHVPPFLHKYPSANCTQGDSTRQGECWGYVTAACPKAIIPPYPDCPKPQEFFNQADFGYVNGFKSSIRPFCHSGTSSLECSDKLTFCRGRNIFIDFHSLPAKQNKVLRYDMDVLNPGDIGGHCKLNKASLSSQFDFMSPLQSWAPELRHFAPISSQEDMDCDLFIETPTFILKLDATVNMYHHFCDFFNLYASLHVNGSASMYSDDVRVLIWENTPYYSSLSPVWKAFTKHLPLWNLNSFGGQRVCFRNAVFPLLPRMVFGLYYNSPLTPSCRDSSLFKAFAQFIPARLQMPPPQKPNGMKIRVTILARVTKHRRILNIKDMMDVVQSRGGEYEVTLAEFTHKTDYIHQLDVILNTDILVGIHGAGLSHMLFLPEWAVVLELSDCGDPSCYFDLSRLRGLKHLGPLKSEVKEDEGRHPTMEGAHAKFTNYSFDPQEFLSLLEEGALYIKNHSAFRTFNTAQNEDIVSIPRNEL